MFDRLEREFHQMALESRKRMRERIKQMDRAALLQHNQQSRLVGRKKATSGNAEDEVDSMANDITASLHRMTRTMQEENDKAILSHQILERSTRKLQGTNVKYDEFGGVLGETSGAIKGLWRRERSDKFWIGLALAAFAAAALHIVLARLWVPPAWLVTVPVRWVVEQWWRKAPVIVKDEPVVHMNTETISTFTNSAVVEQLFTESEVKSIETKADVVQEHPSKEVHNVTKTADVEELTVAEMIPETTRESTEPPVAEETLPFSEPTAEPEPITVEVIPETAPETTEPAVVEEAPTVPEPTTEPEPIDVQPTEAAATPIEAAEEPEPMTAVTEIQDENMPVVEEETISAPTASIEADSENLQEIVISIPTKTASVEEPTSATEAAAETVEEPTPVAESTSIPIPSEVVVTETAPPAPVEESSTPAATPSESYASYGGGASVSFQSSDLDGIDLASDDPFNMSDPSAEAEEPAAAAESINAEESSTPVAAAPSEEVHNDAMASPSTDAPEKEEL